MRIAVTVVIEMTDQQVAGYADVNGLPEPTRAKDVVEDVRAYVLTRIQDSDAFGDQGGYRGADVSLKAGR